MSQTVPEYLFENYKVKKSDQKKVKIDYSSHKIARLYKMAITDAYNASEVNFAGHYVVCTWGCGVGCLDGAMVDIVNGNVYKLPLGETRYYFGCALDKDQDAWSFCQIARYLYPKCASKVKMILKPTLEKRSILLIFGMNRKSNSNY